MKEPTSDQCTEGAEVELPNDYTGGMWHAYAYWYPQMGGYVGKSVILVNEDDPEGCFEAYVWHDGAFPFNEDNGEPAHIHHCLAEQFLDFGKFVQEKQAPGLSNERPTSKKAST